ncbi:glutathione S-transferase [Alphaproteobacteria bacterium]|nr:glutathione S-transferase [Alphaproteobacteria bacterium]
MGDIQHSRPILYSFRRCPFAMRTRIILKLSDIRVTLREIELKDKPDSLLQVSPKATVPVLVLPDKVLEQSMDIIFWALLQSNKYNMMQVWNEDKKASFDFLDKLDNGFKYHLDRYKYESRYEASEKNIHRDQAMAWINALELKLQSSCYLSGDTIGIFDYITLPFIRQFRIADPKWFDNQALPNTQKWLCEFIESAIFTQIMQKMPIWKTTNMETAF